MNIQKTVETLQRETRIAVHWAELASKTTNNRERRDFKNRSARHEKQAAGFRAILEALLKKGDRK